MSCQLLDSVIPIHRNALERVAMVVKARSAVIPIPLVGFTSCDSRFFGENQTLR